MANNPTLKERVAGLETAFHGVKEFLEVQFKHIDDDNAYIRQKLDAIVEILPGKVDNPDCDTKHGGLDKRVRRLEQSVPAVIQTIVIALTTGIVMAIVTAIVSYVVARLP